MPLKGIDLESFEENQSAWIICSSRPYRLRKAVFAENWVAMTYDDVILENGANPLTEGHAELIKKFILELDDFITDLYLSCDSGTSRSPGLAAALLLASGRDDAIIWDNPFYTPNILVFQRMCNSLGIPVTRSEVMLRQSRNEQAYRNAQLNKGAIAFKRYDIIE